MTILATMGCYIELRAVREAPRDTTVNQKVMKTTSPGYVSGLAALLLVFLSVRHARALCLRHYHSSTAFFYSSHHPRTDPPWLWTIRLRRQAEMGWQSQVEGHDGKKFKWWPLACNKHLDCPAPSKAPNNFWLYQCAVWARPGRLWLQPSSG